MAEDRTVLEHLQDGRDALLREVSRLNAAIEQLDTVLVRIGTGGASGVNGSGSATAATASETEDVEPVNPPDEVEPATPAIPSRARATRKATARKSTSAARNQSSSSAGIRAPGGPKQGEAPKSIRVHVLEMLAAENRDFGLAEIIDRVHGAGIQAHDDAVRSITIKLMKDGRVERVGRGQYRLTRRGAAARAASAATATAPRVTEAAPELVISVPAAEGPGDNPQFEATTEPHDVPQDVIDDGSTDDVYSSQELPTNDPEPEPDAVDGVGVSSESEQTGSPDAVETAGDPAAAEASWGGDESAGEHAQPPNESNDYVPPLNLGQPWNG